jgi:hypothetical protein
MNLSGVGSAFASIAMAQSSTPSHNLGELAIMADGRKFRYAKAGAVALVAGTVVQAPAEVANHQNLAPTADVAIGATSFTVTLGATAATANQYVGGWVVVAVTPGVGKQYKIASHPAADASATLLLTLEEPIQVALTTAASRVDLIANSYNGVIIVPTTPTSIPVGVAVYPISIGYYGWIQTGGIATVLSDAGTATALPVCCSNATAGAVETATGTQPQVGFTVSAISTTQYGAVRLTLD